MIFLYIPRPSSPTVRTLDSRDRVALSRAIGCPNRAAGDHVRWSMLTPNKVSLGTQWTATHSLSLNSLIHSRTTMRSQRARTRLRSYRGEFAARDLRAHDRSARSQQAAHQTRLVGSFQRICGSPRASHESKRHEDFAAAACVWSASRGGAAHDLDSMAMSPAREQHEPRSAHTHERAFTVDHSLLVSSTPS